MKVKLILKIIIILILFSCFVFLLAQKINLTTADLGRHLKNGEIIVSQGLASPVLNTNFYSYTHPDHPFINHHWLSGKVFFIIHKISGFSGLSLFYIVLYLLAFLIFFFIASKLSNFPIAALVSLPLIPLMASRAEIRPEVFGYLFCAIFFLFLIAYQKNKITKSRLLILPILSLLWVNLHISFCFGLFLIGVFWFEELVRCKIRGFKKFKWLSVILGISILVSFLNPNTWRGLILPLNIFNDYGYRIVENQSVWFLENYGLNNPNLLLFEIMLGILVLSFIILAIKNCKKLSISLSIIALTFCVMGWLALRNFPLFGFFALPVLAFNIKNVLTPKVKLNTLTANLYFLGLSLIISASVVYNGFSQFQVNWHNFGPGLKSDNNSSAKFFKDNNLQGPIFNNYDIGGYLIYYLYPEHQVFTDNRPETYPPEFFQKIYIPMQEDEKIWKQQELIHGFNTIFFQYHDLTPWAQKFLASRVNDPVWAPVFADNYAIIFLKRNAMNQPVINQYEISKESFRVMRN